MKLSIFYNFLIFFVIVYCSYVEGSPSSSSSSNNNGRTPGSRPADNSPFMPRWRSEQKDRIAILSNADNSRRNPSPTKRRF
ncbi:hypothetical protein HCN44_002624 [Aphidius gifuensis]|uniref:Venom protein n=1 Tax=Aphidius gifuensis TaxID=684658 RepID=A0A834XR83_APHGI|nr:hypothetical protein HCN44_002624 [Aphidius gifuensis]